MPISAPGGVSGLRDPSTEKSQTGERLAAYLDDARGDLSGNTVRAMRADLERFTAWCAEPGALFASRACGHGGGLHRGDGERPCAGHRAPLRLERRRRAQGGRGAEPARGRHCATGPQAHPPAQGVPADAGAGADLGAPPAPAGGRRQSNDRRAEPRDPGRRLRRHATPLRAGCASSR